MCCPSNHPRDGRCVENVCLNFGLKKSHNGNHSVVSEDKEIMVEFASIVSLTWVQGVNHWSFFLICEYNFAEAWDIKGHFVLNL